MKATTHKTEMAMGAARGTVVIPAHNAARTLGVCLDALRAQGVPSSDFSLIVVDDASSDGTAAVASRSDVVVLAGPGTGPAAARNVGARAATGEVLVFLDADTVPEQGWLRELVAPLAEPEVVAVKGRYRSAQRSVLARFAQLEFEWKYARLERAERVDFVDTGTAAYRRNAFLGAGGFDEGFRASEDVDLAFRLAAAGAKIVFNPRAVVLHRHTEDLPGYFGKKVRAAYTRTLVYRRYPRKALGDSYTPPLMGLQIALTGATTVALPLALARFPLARTALCTALTGFVLSVLPMVRRSITSDPTLAPLVPALAFLRAFAQGIGAAGAFAQGMLQRRGDAA
ncbi:MAG: Glycosyltransferase [uncultured Chloroflexi bacterium]|uniref:Glycosyltransferase n=1 Tax=uncultured Chloroflexota bacterium TaxID=166587 RepID=A0A6J4JK71_9CHLR|nr:MAG: Glycosyltransferase [uncultured Chloroflexota bacterium]